MASRSKALVFVDSFSGRAADLKRGQRNVANVLAALARDPRVSTWDMSEHAWLRSLIGDLTKSGLIEERPEPYPWHRYALTDKGLTLLGLPMPK